MAGRTSELHAAGDHRACYPDECPTAERRRFAEIASSIETTTVAEALEDRTPLLHRDDDEARITAAALRHAAGAWAIASTEATDTDTAAALLSDALNAIRMATDLINRHELTTATRSAR